MFPSSYFAPRYFPARYFLSGATPAAPIDPDIIARSLPVATKVELAIDFTRPVYLVKMSFGSGDVFVSSGPQITFASDIYQEGQVSVGTVAWKADGKQSGSITLSNENSAATALILGTSVVDVPIDVYQTYLISGGGNTVPEVYVRGVMDGSRIGASSSVVQIVSSTSGTSFAPGRYYTVGEGFNWLPIDGDTITWGSEVFVLQAADK